MSSASSQSADGATWDLLDPQLRPLFAGGSPALTSETLPQMRAMMAGAAQPPPASTGCVVEERWVGKEGSGGLRLLVFRPPGRGGHLPGLLHFHPGGWVLGKPEMSAETLVGIVEAIGCVIVSVDYRLAPEHPFPAAAEDARAGMEWLETHAGDFGVDVGRIGLLGESAGATLAAGLALFLRDEGLTPPAVQSLIYPAFDDRAALLEPHPHAGRIGLTLDSMHFAWRSFLATDPGADDVSAYASPGRAQTLAGLPATFLGIGALDGLVEENLEFARRLIRAGVPTELHLYPGAPHGFDRASDADVTRQMRRDRIAHLARVLAP